MKSDYNLQTGTTQFRVDNLVKHKASHSFGIDNCTAGRQNNPVAVVCENSFSTYPGGNYLITDCDIAGINRVYCPAPAPTPTPTPREADELECFRVCDPGGGNLTENGGEEIKAESSAFTDETGETDLRLLPCCRIDPLLIDVNGDGFAMTDAPNGVLFDFNGDGVKHHLSWTAQNSDDAWLVLDRNNNGLIDNGSELFGNLTPQPEPSAGETKNGLAALAEYDKPENGGNSDGIISKADTIFTSLRLWRDANHNGISEAGELFKLKTPGLAKIELDYKESRRTDEFGNSFKYRAKVKDAREAQLGRWAWDVFLNVSE